MSGARERYTGGLWEVEKNLPKTGWIGVDFKYTTDHSAEEWLRLGVRVGICDLCFHRGIKNYLAVMHPEYHSGNKILYVGSTCFTELGGTNEELNALVRRRANQRSRKEKWCENGWEEMPCTMELLLQSIGNPNRSMFVHRFKRAKINVTVTIVPGRVIGWSFILDGIRDEVVYDSAMEVRDAAYDAAHPTRVAQVYAENTPEVIGLIPLLREYTRLAVEGIEDNADMKQELQGVLLGIQSAFKRGNASQMEKLLSDWTARRNWWNEQAIIQAYMDQWLEELAARDARILSRHKQAVYLWDERKRLRLQKEKKRMDDALFKAFNAGQSELYRPEYSTPPYHRARKIALSLLNEAYRNGNLSGIEWAIYTWEKHKKPIDAKLLQERQADAVVTEFATNWEKLRLAATSICQVQAAEDEAQAREEKARAMSADPEWYPNRWLRFPGVGYHEISVGSTHCRVHYPSYPVNQWELYINNKRVSLFKTEEEAKHAAWNITHPAKEVHSGG